MKLLLDAVYVDSTSHQMIIPTNRVFNVTNSGIYILYTVVDSKTMKTSLRVRKEDEFIEKIQNNEYIRG